MADVVLYTRPGCCLCDDARAVLERVRARHPGRFVVHERDIETSEALLRRYLERIPVITVDGEEAFELVVEESEVEKRLGNLEGG